MNTPAPSSSPSNPKKKGRMVGIDYGLARIGFSISDERKVIATPFETLAAEKKVDDTARKVCDKLTAISTQFGCEIESVVIGIPLRMNGQVGMMADEVKYFVERLKLLVTCPIILWDERLTSVQAGRSLREGNIRGKKSKQLMDQVTAAIILQSYLDSRSV